MEFQHQPVLMNQTLNSLKLRPGGVYLDGTLGGGGHTEAILQATEPDGKVIGLDQDDEALAAASQRLKPFGERFCPIRANFAEMEQVLAAEGIAGLDGVLLDIGVSSHQLDEPDRGFSYMQDGPLDMRMDRRGGQTAADLVAELSESELANLIYRYGEEKFSRRIARRIVEQRAQTPIESTKQLAELISAAIPAAQRRKEKQHPAKRTFQALRIAVNDELGVLERGLVAAFASLKSGGRLSVITFHSLEDRIVKNYFAGLAKGCECPPEFPVCVCGKQPQALLITRHPQTATEDELQSNPRARSAKLRTVEKL
ncbi:MAG: 16S rRNA (cytosine(1402)-N(4))-methyltransferase RsmH [Peptococcaceae bacterium]|nr:16S rRNA (cytosine(1402)-N(4))-methyltransferase RsmH [Peptococcaceae bacterium]